MHRWLLWIGLIGIGGLIVVSFSTQAGEPSAVALAKDDAEPPPDLINYVQAKDDSFRWKTENKQQTDAGVIYTLDMISQTWHDIAWDHKLQIFIPKGAEITPTILLWNQGGRPSTGSVVLGMEFAKRVGAPVAFLYGIPKQPLFGGKTEDALIAETFVRYLETKDSTWPLLFPMVKSLIRAMDAIQQFAKHEWQREINGFVVTGASKRGWTSWLTAATGDPRIKAIAPLVIDTLNMPVQMMNQVKAFGKPSEMIRDYTNRKLVPIPNTPEAYKLWRMVDPWVYRERITVPKMIINGANDPYWPLDALNSYWDDLKGEKYVLYVPNAGHDLRERDANGKPEILPHRATNTLCAFARCIIFNKPMPQLQWVCSEELGQCKLELKSAAKVRLVRLWIAESPTRDFRPARWEQRPQTELPATVHAPDKGYRAFFAETEYEMDDLIFSLCTQIRILEAKK
ncbi:MAG: PhoPQ-activated pathogenicity-related family protein [Gemmataceae bacterium]|nr:PhoPQ-activated pathogenicity-related family protein [Gemmataceae bacterium]